jgi:hypothetical protein
MNTMNNLCLSCAHSKIIRDHSISHERLICMQNTMYQYELNWPVAYCDHYEDGRARAPFQMKQIAWTVRVKENRIVGFAPPQKGED